MKQENLPPSWVLGTHFPRAVYYRSDACIDASWLDINWKPTVAQGEKSLDGPAHLETRPVFLTPAPSLDASDEGGDLSFSFPSATTCTNGVCVSPPMIFKKDTASLSTFSTSPHIARDLTSAIDLPVSKPPQRSFLSHNSRLKLQDGKQSFASEASTAELDFCKCCHSESIDICTVVKPSNYPNTQEVNYTQRNESTGCFNNNFSNEACGACPMKRDMTRALSWSDHLSNGNGDEEAVLSAEYWMFDLSKLLLGHRFASGAQSRIYHGIYCDAPVAVKIIRQPDDDQFTADRLERAFMQEVNILSCLQHQNIVKFMAACKKPPVLCVATEYLAGGSLRSFLHKREGELLNVHQVVQMALDIAYGMEYVHLKGIIHRDLKSENLVFDKDGHIKILDFGVSCFELACNFDYHDQGTYRWMAPEMLSHKPYTRKVDVYSFGIVLWELLTAHLPYEDMGAVQAAFCVIHENTRPTIPSDCPAMLRNLMCQCWSAEPENRPEFWEIIRLLNTFVES